jgi:hypothetical protein
MRTGEVSEARLFEALDLTFPGIQESGEKWLGLAFHTVL